MLHTGIHWKERLTYRFEFDPTLFETFLRTLLPTCRPRLLQAAARREWRSNVNHTSGKRGLVVSSVRSGSIILGDAADRLGSAGRQGPRHTWLAVSSTADQRRNQKSVEVGKLGCNQDQSTKFCRLRFWQICVGDRIGIVFESPILVFLMC